MQSCSQHLSSCVDKYYLIQYVHLGAWVIELGW